MTDDRYDDRLDAWLCGDLEGEELAAFERDLATDPVLRVRAEEARRAMDDVRDWFAADPPGLDRASSIQPPAPIVPVPVTTPARRGVPVWLQVAAAAALFIAGYAAGQLGGAFQPSAVPRTTAEKNVSPAATPPSVSPAPDSRSPASDDSERVVAQVSARPRVTSQQDGRLRVETTGSLWIVDPNFNLGDSSTTNSK